MIGVCFDGHQQIKPNEVPKRQEPIVVRDDGYNSRRARQIKSRRVHPSALSEIDFHFVPLGISIKYVHADEGEGCIVHPHEDIVVRFFYNLS